MPTWEEQKLCIGASFILAATNGHDPARRVNIEGFCQSCDYLFESIEDAVRSQRGEILLEERELKRYVWGGRQGGHRVYAVCSQRGEILLEERKLEMWGGRGGRQGQVGGVRGVPLGGHNGQPASAEEHAVGCAARARVAMRDGLHAQCVHRLHLGSRGAGQAGSIACPLSPVLPLF